MDAYIAKLAPVIAPKGDLISAAHVTDYRSYVVRLRWVIAHVVPELAYDVSVLAQKQMDKLVPQDFVEANKVYGKLVQAQAEGRARHRIYRQDITQLKCITMSDASFAKEPGSKSQAGFVTMVTGDDVDCASVHATWVEYQSSTIHRVVRSTLAAEAASLSTAMDRQLYVRLVAESMLYGEPTITPAWRSELKIPGILVVDARSLYDHLKTTGSIPKERQVMIDLLAARELAETGGIQINWVPTTHMLADMLTKSMIPPQLVLQFLKTGILALKPTDEEQGVEDHRAALRRGQRQRRKEKMKLQKQQPGA